MTSQPPPRQQSGSAKSTSQSPAISAKPFEIDSITDYLAPHLPPHQAALASLSLSASLLHSASPAHLLASSYLLQRQRHYTAAAFAQLLSSLAHSSTLYVGNLAFTTREEQLLAAFQLPGLRYPASVHMGLNALTRQPCGFAFIAFTAPHHAHTARTLLHTLQIDERTAGIDADQHFKPGREWGRGRSGGQIRDEVRQGWDGGRGGWGARERRQQQMREMKEQQKSTFKHMGDEGHEQREADEEAAGQQQTAKREHGSYAHAQAMRRAGAQQARAVEADAGAETDADVDRANKRQKVDEEAKVAYDGDAQQSAVADESGYAAGSQQSEEGDGAGAYWKEGGEGDGMEEEEKREEDSEWNADRPASTRRDPEHAEEDEEVEHGFGGAEDDTDEPQWT